MATRDYVYEQGEKKGRKASALIITCVFGSFLLIWRRTILRHYSKNTLTQPTLCNRLSCRIVSKRGTSMLVSGVASLVLDRTDTAILTFPSF